ncbi:MAG: toll/interleukin-1 receptor domain-containing protein [Acidobacteriaceae bacterium]|nr:toll/interleukin-1 receptor domain-containing protein [Acidobacteriaceae bacterium]MBV9502462.1 toll/interleukin-1 receptor domain-containing protein [Acidobacteriaceae bacterium]
MWKWDVFISHSSEDKAQVVIPLVNALEGRGVRVWLDDNQILLGDSIVGRIEEGLSKSQFGVVVVSPSFLKRKWTLKELRSFQWSDNILPVWHHVSADDVRAHAPLLADLKAINTTAGIDVVADVILRKLYVIESHSTDVPNRLRFEFAELLRGASKSAVQEFLFENRMILLKAFGLNAVAFLRFDITMGSSVRIDVAYSSYQPSAMRYGDWRLVWLLEPDRPLFQGEIPQIALATALSDIEATREWIKNNPDKAKQILPDIAPSFRGYVVGGSRPAAGSVETRSLSHLNERLADITVRTYQWLLDGLIKERVERAPG